MIVEIRYVKNIEVPTDCFAFVFEKMEKIPQLIFVVIL